MSVMASTMKLYEQRWYDQNPTLAMAVSLLLNTSGWVQDEVTNSLYEQIARINPVALHQVLDDSQSMWFNRRTSMGRRTWMVIESMRFLSEAECFGLARGIIEAVFRLESQTEHLLEHEPTTRLERLSISPLYDIAY
ncbi:MAG: hypothetical protein R2857_01700 [Vampirovibrionales bacterium]